MTEAWPPQPTLYEIPAWPWLEGLSRRYGRRLTLGEIPEEVFEGVLGRFDAVWLMGVWERSPQARALALAHEGLQATYHRVLPGWTPADVPGSPYAVHAYHADAFFGGDEGLRAFRNALAKRGKKLILDYVPNHVAVDHPWTRLSAPLFIAGTEDNLAQAPQAWVRCGQQILAHGRDPYFDPWTDTVQINAFSPEARRRTTETLLHLAKLCDGVRCDMAMLLLTEIFQKTWSGLAGEAPEAEFWHEVIPAVKAAHPQFLLIAEAYWDKEWDLMQLGFDFCYDKRLYDRWVQGDAEALRLHLRASPGYQRRLLRFLENHDEPRAAASMEEARLCAAALMLFTLPGARLFYEGQFEGRRIQTPVQLGRTPEEGLHPGLAACYQHLLSQPFQTWAGDWRLCATESLGGEGGDPWVAYFWKVEGEPWLVAVNFGPRHAQAHIRVPDFAWGGGDWTLEDVWGGGVYTYFGQDLEAYGLYVSLPPWQAHVFKLKASS